MNEVHHLNNKWIKASILGTVWASSEIVLGSFLHNLRVPFSGNILTAIGIVILISAQYKWKEKGLFWRAGIVCALMKTMSPSAVIFGPMVAIFSEALLLEVSVRLLGRTVAGFMLGSVLAMSWNLFQKIFNYIIFYGYNIVEVYKNLMIYAEKELGLRFDAVWTPILILLALYALFGAVAAWIGIRTGRHINENQLLLADVNEQKEPVSTSRKKVNFRYSFTWLSFDMISLVIPLFLVDRIPFGVWVILVVAIASTWAIRYKRALRQLVRPRLWIFFILITLVTAFVFTRLQSEQKTTLDAILIGVEMNLRAIILIMGFTVLGTELYNPKIRKYFSRSYFKQLPLALELSVESLPMMIAHTPDFKTVIKDPFLFVQQIMAFADFRLQQIRTGKVQTKLIILTGEIGSGKTMVLKKLIQQFQKDRIKVGGFYQERIVEKDETVGYDFVEIETGRRFEFLRKNASGSHRVGKYSINTEVFPIGKEILATVRQSIVVVDEIGKMENKGDGWAAAFATLLQSNNVQIIASFRKELLKELQQKFDITNAPVFDLDAEDLETILGRIIQMVKENSAIIAEAK
ncbi:MAG TPA: nucleoside-triphosphatase [Draconibacterium sp.]|nr:nucleoside-triphosphatase [Draconibacterium sp.]